MLQRIRSFFYRLLRKSERLTKTDMVYLAKGGFWLTISRLFSILLSILLSIALANLLPKESYGVYRYILSVASVLAVVSLSGLNTAITRSVAQGAEAVVKSGFKYRLQWGFVASFFSACISGYYHLSGSTTLTLSFLIVAVFLPLMEASTVSEAFLLGKKNFSLASRCGMLSKFFTIITLVATIFFTKNVILIVFSYFFSWTVIRLLIYTYTLKKYSLNSSNDPDALSFGKHLTISSVIATIADYIDRLLLFTYLGPVELAVYSFALAPNDHIKGFLKNINVLALPKFSEKSPAQLKYSIKKKTILLLIFSLIVSLIFIFTAPFIYSLLFPQYLESVLYFQILISSLFTLPFLWLITSIFQSQKMTKAIYQSQILTSIFQIITTTILILYLGLLGAVIARVLHRVVSLIIKAALLKFHL